MMEQEIIKENLERVEKGEPLTLPLAVLNGEFKKQYYAKTESQVRKEKRKAYDKAYRETHKEKIKAYKKAYYEAHKKKKHHLSRNT